MAFASPLLTAVAVFRPTTLLASSIRSLPPKGKTERGLASGSLRVLCIGSAARSECAAECIRKIAAHVFQFSFRTRRRLLFSMQTRKGHQFQPMAARSFGWQFASVPGSTVPVLLRTTSPNRENGALKNELRRLSNAAFDWARIDSLTQ